ncbi:7105_t:CDS:1, partial [Racocetra persica]
DELNDLLDPSVDNIPEYFNEDEYLETDEEKELEEVMLSNWMILLGIRLNTTLTVLLA